MKHLDSLTLPVHQHQALIDLRQRLLNTRSIEAIILYGSAARGMEWGRFYDRLFEDCQEGDYIALIAFDQEYVKAQMMRCAQFLEHLRPLLASLPQD